MNQKTHIARSVHAAAEKAQYDHEVKQLFRNKTILAWILRHTTKEFRELSIETIVECIEGEPEIAKIPVYPGHVPEAITGSDTSDKVIGEGEITYDVRFYAITPDEEHVKLLLNVEAQKDYYPGYDLVTRGIFYGARMISAQLDTEFTADDYDGIRKVYSIWVCMNAPKYAQETITGYSFQPTKIYGDFNGNARYDLISVITICLGNSDCENELLGMLSTLLSPELAPEQKEVILQEYGIAITELKEEVSTMCNLSDLIEERGIEKGRAAERKNTEIERERADKEQERADNEKKRGWKAVISLCGEVGMNREQTILQLMDKCELDRETAEGLVETSWWK